MDRNVTTTTGCMTADQTYTVSVTLAVRSPQQLWRFAAARAIALTGLDQSDIEDMIGPMDDPQIGDCLALILEPQPIAGCALRGLDVVPHQPRAQAKRARKSATSPSSPTIGDEWRNRVLGLPQS